MTALFLKVFRFGRKLIFFAVEKLFESYDKLLLMARVPVVPVFYDAEKPLILYSGYSPNFRVLKQIKILLESKEFRVGLLHHHNAKAVAKQVHPQCLIFSFRNKFHLQRLLLVSNQNLLVAYSSIPEFAAVSIKYSNSKALFDPYDCLVVYYGLQPHLKWMQHELPFEKYCFENTNGIIARNLEVNESLRRYNLPSKKTLLFSDYCDNANFTLAEKTIEENTEISLVYAGGLYGKSARGSSHGIENFDALISSLPQNKIYLHLYPNPDAPTDYYYDYIVEQKQNPFLKVHKSIFQKQMGAELSKYHFGVLPHFKDSTSKISAEKLAYGTSNKFFNFLEAGLPILVSNEMTFMAWIVKRYKIGIVFDAQEQEHLRPILENCNYALLQQNVRSVREKLSMHHNQQRFIKFVLQFINNKTWEN